MLTRRDVLLGAGAAAVGTALAGHSPAGAAGRTYGVSTATRLIRPPSSVALPPMGGYSDPGARYGTAADLKARCVVFWDEGYPNVIVSVEVLGIPPTLNQSIRSGAQALGVANSDLVICATHTHNAPALTGYLDPIIAYNATTSDISKINTYTNWLSTQVVGVISDALNAAQSQCILTFAVGSANFSRQRAGLSAYYTQTNVPVLTARTVANGFAKAIVYGYACHPVAAGKQYAWNGDYPGVASNLLEQAYSGCTALFALGCAGDQNPAITGSQPAVIQYGTDLKNAVVAAVGAYGTVYDGAISTVYGDLPLPLDVTLTSANLAAVRGIYAAREANGIAGTLASESPYYKRHGAFWKTYLDNNGNSYLPSNINCPVQTWKIARSGDPSPLRLTFLGHEVVSGYDFYFRSYFGQNKIWLSAYSNECTCYIPSNELLANPGYEAGWSSDYPGVAGGSMIYYNWPAHFRAGSGGVESTLISAVFGQTL